MKRVVVTGIGALTPIGNDVKAYTKALKEGQSGAGKITQFDADEFKVRFACELKNFDASSVIERREMRRMDQFTQYALMVVDEAMQMTGLDIEQMDPNRAGVIWGSGIGGLKSLENEVIDFARSNGLPRYNPFMIPKMIIDIAPGLISIKYGFKGLNYATVSACASASHAIINATDYIRMGRADVIICGGSEAAVTQAGVGGFSAMKALSTRNDDPKKASRPFDVDRDGFVLGEGAAALILESYEHAMERGANIIAEVAGVGMTADAYHMTAPEPSGDGAKRVMLATLADANCKPEDVDYINVHGTSTPLGDVAELKAIESVFGQGAKGINISSTKSMTGHLLGAAGAIEAVASIIAMREGFVPPTINNFNLDPEINPELNLTLNKAQTRDINICLSNTFGFGGHNACVMFKKY